MYKNGDEVIYRGQLYRVIINSRDALLLDSSFNGDWEVANISEVTPYIESNKEGKHLLERLED